jgi:ketosteroid isomerase-like protein
MIKETPMTAPVSRAVVAAFYQAYASRDQAKIAPFIDDNAEWMIVGPIDIFPFCGRRRGKAAVLELFARVVPELLQITGVVTDQLLVDGDCAAALNRLTAIQRSTGRIISYRSAQFVRFRNNKVVDFRSLIDSFDAAEQVLGHHIDIRPEEPLAIPVLA